MTTKTASERGRSNRNKGQRTENLVAGYLRTVGFTGAERAIRTGYSTPQHTYTDPLDITGIPGVVISIKNDKSNQITKWLDEAERIGNHHGAELALLITRRHYKPPAQWWSWINLATLTRATTGHRAPGLNAPICLELGALVPLLHQAGYGHPPQH